MVWIDEGVCIIGLVCHGRQGKMQGNVWQGKARMTNSWHGDQVCTIMEFLAYEESVTMEGS